MYIVDLQEIPQLVTFPNTLIIYPQGLRQFRTVQWSHTLVCQVIHGADVTTWANTQKPSSTTQICRVTEATTWDRLSALRIF